MNILAVAAMMPPTHWAGSEVSTHTLLHELARRGHQVRALVLKGGGEYKGVTSRCINQIGTKGRMGDAAWADVIVGQQSGQAIAADLGRRAGRPAVIWAHTWHHDKGQPPSVDRRALASGATVVVNSHAAAQSFRHAHPGTSPLVMRPLVRVADYQVGTTGPAVGQVNLSVLKGGPVLQRVALACPHRSFVGRLGWDLDRNASRAIKWPANVTVEPTSPDMGGFYRQVRVLLMPSIMESWGRVGVEAACSGIPTVAHPTPGLREALADAATWADRDDTDAWVNALDALDDPATYAEASTLARERAADLERLALADIDRFEEHAMAEATKPVRKPRAAKPKATEPTVAVLVPWKPGVPERERAWDHTRSHWQTDFPAWPVIEGVHDDEPFNRSRAVNTAAQLAGRHDVLVIADADSLVDGRQVRAAVDAAHRSGQVTFAHDIWLGLNRAMSDRVLTGWGGSWQPGVRLRLKDTASSCVAVPWPLWEKIGGFDERFVGWGAEDVAFSLACQVIGGGFHRIPGPVWHLWHPKSPTNDVRQPTYAANNALSQRYVDAYLPKHDVAAMRAILDEARQARLVAV